MARPLRICIPGGLYHVIARGNARERVYRSDDDRELFLEIFDHATDRYSLRCHGYCLMRNHYHLIVETPRANLPIAMRQLNGLYARRYNLRHGRCGHVFEARYRSIFVEKESHLDGLSRYVDLNPVRAGICPDPADYRWSSHRATIGLSAPPRFLTSDWILARFGSTRRIAQARYRAYVAEGIDDALAERVRGERLGSEEFLRETFGHDPPIAEIPRAQIEPAPPSLAEIFTRHRWLPIFVAYRRHGYTIGQIADHLDCHYST
jgi:putative transposase